MCGRYALGIPRHELQQLLGNDVPIGEWVNEDQFHPRYNVAPRSQAPVVRRGRDGPSDAPSRIPSDSGFGDLVLHTMKWGLVPHWSKHEDLTLNTINARGENLVDGTGMWKSLRGWKRCAIPCDGYYEWLKKGKERVPHFTKRKDGKPLLLAGLYDSVVLEGQTDPLFTFTIVTTEANEEFSWLHDRQPVMLSSTESLNLWLDTTNHKWDLQVADLLQPYHDWATPLTCYQVPKEVGKVGAESPTFVEPIAERKDGIQAMFARQTHKQTTTPSSSQIKIVPSTPTKRKRSSSPSTSATPSRVGSKRAKMEGAHAERDVIDLCNLSQGSPLAAKGKSVEKLNAWEDDGIEHVDTPSPSQSKGKVKGGGKTPSSPKKSNKTSEGASNSKITAFFNRSKP